MQASKINNLGLALINYKISLKLYIRIKYIFIIETLKLYILYIILLLGIRHVR